MVQPEYKGLEQTDAGHSDALEGTQQVFQYITVRLSVSELREEAEIQEAGGRN